MNVLLSLEALINAYLVTLEEWQQIEEKMKTLPMTKKTHVNLCVCSSLVL